MENVLLVVPPEEYITKDYLPPLGIGYIAAVLDSEGFNVSILDSNVDNMGVGPIIDEVLHRAPDMIGITGTSHTRFQVRRILEGIDELDSLKVLGGVHFSQTDIDALEQLRADVIVRGEGEYSMLELAQGHSLASVRGISFRDGARIVRNPDRSLISNLDQLPFPARHKFQLQKYNAQLEGMENTNLRSTSIMTSRGCPNACVFCANSSFWKQVFRRRNPMSVVDEIEHVVSTYGISGFDIWDDTFTVNKKHVTQICDEIINRGIDVQWYARVRVNTVNKEVLSKMKKAGCISLSFGVESGSPRILKVIKKNITLDQVRDISRACDELSLFTKAFFMVNHPQETLEDVGKTLDFIDELILHYEKITPIVGTTLIYPGTALERVAKREGLLAPDFSWNTDFFSERNKMYGLSPFVPAYENISLDHLNKFVDSRKETTKLIRKGLKTIKKIRKPKDVHNLISNVSDIIKNKIKSKIQESNGHDG